MAVTSRRYLVTKSQLTMLNVYGVFSALMLFLYAIQLFKMEFLRIHALDRFMDKMDTGSGFTKILIFILGINIFVSPITLGILAFINFRWDSQGYKLLGTIFIASVVVFLFGLVSSR